MMFWSGLLVGLLAGTSFGFLLFGLMDAGRGKGATISGIVMSLRQIAQKCVRLARACPHSATTDGLHEVAVELTDRADELEKFYFE